MKIEISSEVSSALESQLASDLREYNRRFAGDDYHEPLRLIARHDTRVLGGLLGGTYWGYLYISILVVDEQHRGKGIGTKLLLEAERLASERGCRHVCLDTHDFQGIYFYERHGYEVVGQLPDLPPGHTKFTLHKVMH